MSQSSQSVSDSMKESMILKLYGITLNDSILESCVEFLRTNSEFTSRPIGYIVEIDYELFNPCMKKLLREHPYQVLTTLSACIHIKAELGDLDSRLECRIKNFTPISSLKHLKSNIVDKFISIKGTVVRSSPIKPLVVQMDFKCSRCGEIETVQFPSGRFQAPGNCSAPRCRSSSFSYLKETATTIDWQVLRIQEEDLDLDSEDQGRVPRSLDCELSNDLVDKCIPGDEVIFSGIIKAGKTDSGKINHDKARNIFVLYLDVNYLENSRDKDNNQGYWDSFSEEDFQVIRKMHENPNLFPLLIHSMNPHIYGQDIVKAGLCLVCFSGSNKSNSRGGREESHILIVGY